MPASTTRWQKRGKILLLPLRKRARRISQRVSRTRSSRRARSWRTAGRAAARGAGAPSIDTVGAEGIGRHLDPEARTVGDRHPAAALLDRLAQHGHPQRVLRAVEFEQRLDREEP